MVAKNISAIIKIIIDKNPAILLSKILLFLLCQNHLVDETNISKPTIKIGNKNNPPNSLSAHPSGPHLKISGKGIIIKNADNEKRNK